MKSPGNLKNVLENTGIGHFLNLEPFLETKNSLIGYTLSLGKTTHPPWEIQVLGCDELSGEVCVCI